MTKVNKKEEKVVKKADEDWMTKKWRPMMAMMYMTCCLFDFALFPIMFTIVQFWETQAANYAFRQWVPITLQGGGLFHVAMGGVLGVTAYGRTQEKVAGAANVSTSLPDSGVPTPSLSSSVPAFTGSTPSPSTGFASAPSTGFATEPAPGFNSAPTAPGGRRPVTPGFNL
jgi:hypothetical protein